jgi:hypothetical protein
MVSAAKRVDPPTSTAAPVSPGQAAAPQPRWLWVTTGLFVIVLAIIAGTVAMLNGNGHQQHTITYSVTGCCADVIIVYRVPEGSGQSGKAEDNKVALPWSKTVIASGPLTGYSVSTGPGIQGGSVTCTISEDGKMLDQNTAQRTAGGAPSTATCSLPGS